MPSISLYLRPGLSSSTLILRFDIPAETLPQDPWPSQEALVWGRQLPFSHRRRFFMCYASDIKGNIEKGDRWAYLPDNLDTSKRSENA
ncbi:MAG: hypothetical protein LBP92_02775 [Deltaproteobacteria bacterium]|jgi:hypothetical protein|nr:hypothetical protein [Deltaproteobacteria bacterium]